MKDLKTDICENRQKAANAWKNVMKGPPTAPVCKGGIISEGLFNLVPFSKKNNCSCLYILDLTVILCKISNFDLGVQVLRGMFLKLS